jgi:two-component system chemotaxis sensor kinase CheA
MESSMVIYETGKHEFPEDENGEQMAMPLSAVERIECVPLSEIEYAGGRAVLQYRGELIPLEDEGEVLREMSAAKGTTAVRVAEAERWARGRGAGAESAEADGSTATVLICLRSEARGVRRVGMVVRRVLDVSAGTLLAADAAACEEQLAMVKNRVTTVHREFAQQVDGPTMAILKEVA